MMLKRYGDRALEESAARADELALAGDDEGAATWRRIMAAVTQLANNTPPGRGVKQGGEVVRRPSSLGLGGYRDGALSPKLRQPPANTSPPGLSRANFGHEDDVPSLDEFEERAVCWNVIGPKSHSSSGQS